MACANAAFLVWHSRTLTSRRVFVVFCRSALCSEINYVAFAYQVSCECFGGKTRVAVGGERITG
jgi:hypothetical protein